MAGSRDINEMRLLMVESETMVAMTPGYEWTKICAYMVMREKCRKQ